MGMREIWDQAKEIVGLALEQKTEERSAFVRKACGDDATLLAEVESLLSNYNGADSLLENSPAANVLAFHPVVMTGKKIGAYRIVREIGQGGMAVVYLGERDDQNFRKQVAIKMVKPGIDTEQILHRFRNERQTLAALDHSNIVKLLDGGSSEDGLPYLVMEYVEGLPIDQYCDQNKLSIDDRLRLFRQVCSAVQYAHENLVIHRDLKPGNILIAKGGVPRLLDFGIAKLLNPECFQTPLVTRTDWRPMTPEYASPEQIRGQAITTASDVYSLGALLFELLTGHRPYRATSQSLLEMERLVCETEPEKPSAVVQASQTKAKLARDGDAGNVLAAESMSNECGLQPVELQRRLRGDLDTITLKAIEKDPSRRYATASELSADIGRHLAHEPVLARPASARYRAGKYIRRHPVGVTVAAGVVLLLAGFAAMQTFQLRRITRERDRANWVTGFMEGMFKVSDPSEARGNSITAREILDKASTDITTAPAQDPELQAQMMHVMGDVYKNLGLFPRAQSLYERSAEIRRRILGPENSDTLRSVDDLAWILNQEGHFADAEKLQRQTVATRRRVFGTQNLDTLKSISNLAWTLDREGNYAEAERLEREVLDIRRRVLKIEDDRETALTMGNLAATLGHEGHYPESEKLKRETLDIRRRILGPEHQETLTAMNNLAATFQLEGRYAEAENLQRETLNTQRRILGSEHPDTLRSINNLAHTLVMEGHLAEAEPLQREALATKQRVLGLEHQDTLWAMNSLAWTLQQEGRFPDAEKLQRQTLEIQRRVLGPDRPNTLSTVADLAVTLTKERQYSEAESLLRQDIETMRRVLGPEHPFTLQAADEMVQTLEAEGRNAEAEKWARETLEIQRRVVGPDHPDTASTTYDLACVLAQSGRHDEALSLLREAIDHKLEPATDLAMATAPELKPLRNDPRFATLVSYARQRATTQEPK
jgi:serine/threonine protein kinase/tetratricopeptide (TPR) repeat protein